MDVCSKCGKKFGLFRAKKPSQILIQKAQEQDIPIPDDICSMCLEILCAETIKAREEAKKQEEARESYIENILVNSLFSEQFDTVTKKIFDYSQEQRIEADAIAQYIKKSMYKVIKNSLEDNIITNEEEDKISSLLSAYELSEENISDDSRLLLTKGRVVTDLIEGKANPDITWPDLPFQLTKSELLIWGFPTLAYELKTVSKFVGGSQGLSIRIMKGVYWRTGAFKGERVSSEEMIELGTSMVAITSQHLYFTIGLSSRRIKHSKIIRIEPYLNGVLVVQDGARAKPLIFLTDDPWFFINVLQNAQNWA